MPKKKGTTVRIAKNAKAGKRKQYTTGKRKVKSWATNRQGFVMPETKDYDNRVFNEHWKTGDPVMVARQ